MRKTRRVRRARSARSTMSGNYADHDLISITNLSNGQRSFKVKSPLARRERKREPENILTILDIPKDALKSSNVLRSKCIHTT
jgi:hypothetical protein